MSEPAGRTAQSTGSQTPKLHAGVRVYDHVTKRAGSITECQPEGLTVHYRADNGHEWDRRYSWEDGRERLRWGPELDLPIPLPAAPDTDGEGLK